MFKAWHVWPEPRKAFSGTRPSAKDSPSFGISSNSNLKQCRTANVYPTSLFQFCCVFLQVPENVVLMKLVTSPLCSKETHENLRNNLKRLTSIIISPKGSQKCKKNSVLYHRATKSTQTRSDKCPLQPGLVWYIVSVIANLSFRVTRFALFQSWECSHFFQLHLCCREPVLSKTSADNLATKKKQHIYLFDRFDVIYLNLWSSYDFLSWRIRFVQSICFKLFVPHRFTSKLQCAKLQFFGRTPRSVSFSGSAPSMCFHFPKLPWNGRQGWVEEEVNVLLWRFRSNHLSLKKHMDTSSGISISSSVLSFVCASKFLHSDNFPLCLAGSYKSKRSKRYKNGIKICSNQSLASNISYDFNMCQPPLAIWPINTKSTPLEVVQTRAATAEDADERAPPPVAIFWLGRNKNCRRVDFWHWNLISHKAFNQLGCAFFFLCVSEF